MKETVVSEKTIIPPDALVTGSPGEIKKTYENRKKIELRIKTISEDHIENSQNFASNEMFYEIEGWCSGHLKRFCF